MNPIGRLVVIESPYAASSEAGVEDHVRYARRCMRDALLRGEAPFASHLLYTQEGVLDDAPDLSLREAPDLSLREAGGEERELGIRAGLSWAHHTGAASVFYLDFGVSRGMRRGFHHALGQRAIELRKLDSVLTDEERQQAWFDLYRGARS